MVVLLGAEGRSDKSRSGQAGVTRTDWEGI